MTKPVSPKPHGIGEKIFFDEYKSPIPPYPVTYPKDPTIAQKTVKKLQNLLFNKNPDSSPGKALKIKPRKVKVIKSVVEIEAKEEEDSSRLRVRRYTVAGACVSPRKKPEARRRLSVESTTSVSSSSSATSMGSLI